MTHCCRSFVQVCHEALLLNSRLITADQMEYHESLLRNYSNCVSRLEDIFDERVKQHYIVYLLVVSVHFTCGCLALHPSGIAVLNLQL